ncbi:transposase [Nocardia carnea]|uniref:transposase n=1 Tax=Nocardia carnea TaxID=37328 RepID=UPI002454AFC3|nr:transposase [Nocardia carnea]
MPVPVVVPAHHRLSRHGDRELNSALYTIAMIQIRMACSVGRSYYDKKISEGKSPREAKRCLNDAWQACAGEPCPGTKGT